MTITPTDKEVSYSADGIGIPVEGMFTITDGAGAATYTVTNDDGVGTYDAQTGRLTVTACGTFTVKVSTAETATHAAGAETSATLTVNKVDPVFTVPSFTVAAGSKLGDLAFAQPSNGTFEWQDDVDTSVGEVGETNTFRAKFTPKYTENYNTVENVEVKVTVTSPVVPVTGVKLDKATATVEASKTVKLTATVEPADAMDKAVTWTSSDEKVATVKDGTVTAVAAGKATITASAGGKTATCEVTVTEPEPEPAPAEVPPVSVTAHVQRKGTLPAVSGGAVAGTTGKSLRLESLKLTVPGASATGGIEYRSHVQGKGWEKAYARDGELSGTEGKGKRLEAVKIRLWGDMRDKYDVWYRVHSQRYGWMAWAKNGERAGTQGKGLRAEAIQVVLVRKDAPAPATDFQGATQSYAKAFVKK